MKFYIAVQKEFPAIEEAAASEDEFLQTLEDFGHLVCDRVKSVDTQYEGATAVLELWSELDENDQALVGDIAEFSELSKMALNAYCPEDAERILGSG